MTSVEEFELCIERYSVLSTWSYIKVMTIAPVSCYIEKKNSQGMSKSLKYLYENNTTEVHNARGWKQVDTTRQIQTRLPCRRWLFSGHVGFKSDPKNITNQRRASNEILSLSETKDRSLCLFSSSEFIRTLQAYDSPPLWPALGTAKRPLLSFLVSGFIPMDCLHFSPWKCL